MYRSEHGRSCARLLAAGALALLASAAGAADVDVLISEFTDTPDPAPRGGEIAYRIEIANNGANVAGDVTLSVPIPADTVFVSVATSAGSCMHDGGSPGALSCDFGSLPPTDEDPGTPAPDPVVVDLVIQTTAATGATVDILGTVGISSADNDTNPANNVLGQNTTIDDGADLTVPQSDAPDPVAAGGTLRYTLTVHNAGPNDAVDLEITDALPPEVTYQSFEAPAGSGWSCTHDGTNPGGTVTCTRAGAVSPGADAPALTLVTRVTGSRTGTMTNQASVRSATADPFPDNDGSTEDTTVIEGTDLSIGKSVNPASPIAGDGAVFTLTPRNLGPFDAADVTVTDTLPAGVSFQSAGGPGWSCVHDGTSPGGTVTCTRASYVVGATDDIDISVTVDPAAVGTLSNTATIATTTTDPQPANDSTTLDFSVVPDGADLAVSKTKAPDPVALGSDMTSTLTVHNNGPRDTSGTVTVTDALSSGETFVSATGSGWSCSHGGGSPGGTVTCTYSGSIAAGDSAPALTVVTTASAAGTLTNTASVRDDGGQQDLVPDNDSDTKGVTATTERADLQVTKAVAPATLTINDDTLTYTVTLLNAGPDPAGGIELLDHIPAYVSGTGVSVSDDSGGNFNCSGHGTVRCNSVAGYQLAAGAAVHFTITVDRPLRDGGFTNTASAYSSLVGDPDRSNNRGSVPLTIEPVTDLEVTGKSVQPNPVRAGVQAVYVISLRNNGPSTAANVVLDDVFTVPAGRSFTFIDATPSKGSCDPFDAGTLSLHCQLGDLASGETQTVTVTVRPDWDSANDSWTLDNTATAATDTHESNLGNNAQVAQLTVEPAALDLLVNKTDMVDPLGFDPTSPATNVITYEVTIRNRGPSLGTGLTLTDDFTPKSGKELRFLCDKAAANDDCGDVAVLNAALCNQLGTSVTGPATLNIQCALPDLPAGDTYTRYLDFLVVTPPDSTGDTHDNTVTIDVNEDDTLPANDIEAETTTVRQRVDLSVTKAASASPVSVFEPFLWTVVVTNQGPGDSNQTDLTDTLPAGMEFHGAAPSWNGIDPVASGTCVTSGRDLSCDLGTVNNGGRVTVTIPVRATVSGDLDNCATASTDQVDPALGNNVTVCATVRVQASSLAGLVYRDPNDNGQPDGGVETGIAGVQIQLSGMDAYGNSVSRSTTTAADGTFLFDELPPSGPDGYTLTETQPAGYFDGQDAVGSAVIAGSRATDVISGIVLPADTDLTGHYFGELPPSSLAGNVWHDRDNDGIRDPGEPPIAGVTVTLTGTDVYGNAVSRSTTTSATGAYAFSDLPAGTYTVTETQPAGWLDGKDSPGDSGGTVAADEVRDIQLPFGVDRTQIDFGELAPASIAGSVYIDPDQDAVRDPGEDLVIPDVEVRLTGVDDLGNPVNRSLSTGTDGAYRFNGLRPGTYTVTETRPAGLEATGAQVGSPGNGTPATDATAQAVSDITIVSADALVDYNFGHLGGRVEGVVFLDANANGVYDGPATDTPLAGVPVAVTDSNGDVHNLVTDAGGYFSRVVPVGQTQVDVDETALPPNYTLTTDAHDEGSDPTTVSVPLGGVARDNTGYVDSTDQTSRVEGRVYQDENRNGRYDPGIDIPYVGVRVVVTNSAGGVATLVTDANGEFSRIVPAGPTVVDVVEADLPEGVVLTRNDLGNGTDSTTVDVPVGGVARDDTGYVVLPATESARVEGTVYHDVDGDGLFDPAADTPLPGVRVVITAANGAVYTLLTGTDGGFSRLVVPGATVIDVDDASLPAGATLTTDAHGDGNDPTTVVVPAGGVARDDNGYQFPAELARVEGTVYIDRNRDGLLEPGDSVLPNVLVTVTTATGGIYRIRTDENGFFQQAVPPGETVVEVDRGTLPGGIRGLTTDEHGQGSNPTVLLIPAGGVGVDNTGWLLIPPAQKIPTLGFWWTLALALLLLVVAWRERRRLGGP